MAVRTYVSVAGPSVVIHPDEQVWKYEKDGWEAWLTDPISLDRITRPVIYQGNLYEEKYLLTWLLKSTLDPLTGQVGPPLDWARPCQEFWDLKYVLLCLEECSDYFLFHSVPTDVTFARQLIRGVAETSTLVDLSCYSYARLGQAQDITELNVLMDYTLLQPQSLPAGTIFLNCILPDWVRHREDLIIEDTIRPLDVWDLLFTCHLTGRPLNSPGIRLSDSGHLVGTESPGSWLCPALHRELSQLVPPRRRYWHRGFPVDYQKLITTQPSFQPRPVGADLLNLAIQHDALIRENSEYQVLQRHLSTLALSEIPLIRLRWKYPCLSAELDLSLLHFSNRIFRQLEIKDAIFTRTSFSHCQFVACRFARCCFSGSSLVNCEFNQCHFYLYSTGVGVEYDDQTKFIHCVSPAGTILSVAHWLKVGGG